MTHPHWNALNVFETIFREQGLMVAGTDEVGRGPLAGPVVAAAVILPAQASFVNLDDSKKLSEKQRLELADAIEAQALAIGIGGVGPRTIEAINILEASRLAMRRAIAHLSVKPDVVLTDAMALPESPHHTIAIIRGDQRSASVAAASIIAKVVRDWYMEELDQSYPEYGFGRHKGYATREHRAALARCGPCPAHRQTFLHWQEDAAGL
jgi:ribonuclease HII